jgi:hypothetical protein
MHRTRTILAIILVATGLVWIGQGTGVLQGQSFMVGEPLWAIIGTACLVVGLAVGGAEVRRRRT